jgi:hypothetical protein
MLLTTTEMWKITFEQIINPWKISQQRRMKVKTIFQVPSFVIIFHDFQIDFKKERIAYYFLFIFWPRMEPSPLLLRPLLAFYTNPGW